MSNHDVETAIRNALDRMGIQQDDEDERARVASRPVAASLSEAIAGTRDPETILRGTVALNDDKTLAKMVGADTLNGQKF